MSTTTHEVTTEICVPVTLLYDIDESGEVSLLSIVVGGGWTAPMATAIDPMDLPETERRGMVRLAKQHARKLAAEAELERGLSAQESREYERGIEG